MMRLHPGTMCRVLYRFLASLARLAVRSGRSKDLKIIVLRHQLTVLHRQNNRPAFAERWIGTLRRDLIDRTIIWNRRQLERLVVDYIDHYNTHRPHRSLDQRPPVATDAADQPDGHLQVVRTARCGGLINEYRNAA